MQADPPPALATALAVLDADMAARELAKAFGALNDDEAARDAATATAVAAWAAVRQAALASVTAAAAPARPTSLEAEARGALERYASAIAGLEPSVDSAMGIGVAAAGALVHLATLGVCALSRLAGDAPAAEQLLATPAPELLTNALGQR